MLILLCQGMAYRAHLARPPIPTHCVLGQGAISPDGVEYVYCRTHVLRRQAAKDVSSLGLLAEEMRVRAAEKQRVRPDTARADSKSAIRQKDKRLIDGGPCV
jgi:hypothetical protein